MLPLPVTVAKEGRFKRIPKPIIPLKISPRLRGVMHPNIKTTNNSPTRRE